MERQGLSQIIAIVIILALFSIGIYGVLRIRNNVEESTSMTPEVAVNIEDNTVTKKDAIEVKGTTDATELLINNDPVEVADDDTYSYVVPLSVGENLVSIEATSDGETTVVERIVVRESAIASAPDSATTQEATSDDLTGSGPAESFGIIAITGILVSTYIYRKSRKKGLKPRYKLFTDSHF